MKPMSAPYPAALTLVEPVSTIEHRLSVLWNHLPLVEGCFVVSYINKRSTRFSTTVWNARSNAEGLFVIFICKSRVISGFWMTLCLHGPLLLDKSRTQDCGSFWVGRSLTGHTSNGLRRVVGDLVTRLVAFSIRLREIRFLTPNGCVAEIMKSVTLRRLRCLLEHTFYGLVDLYPSTGFYRHPQHPRRGDLDT